MSSNKLLTYTKLYAYYNGIYFSCTMNLIYAAPSGLTYIQVFDLNLILNYTIDLSLNFSLNCPVSISEYNNELYVGTNNGLVLVIVNKIVIRYFSGCSLVPIYSLVFDNCGLMAITCSAYNLINLYYYNGTSTRKNLTTPGIVYVGFDSKGRFVLLSSTESN
jgi:hypothetical protein